MSALAEERESRPAGNRTAESSKGIEGVSSLVADRAGRLYLDAVARSHQGVLVVRVEVGQFGRTRTLIYKSLDSAQRAADRARRRGASVHVTVCQLVPAGVLVAEGGDRR